MHRPRWQSTLLYVELLIWLVGTQTIELLATAGPWLCIVTVVALTSSTWTWRSLWGRVRAWSPLAAFILWALLIPWIGGRPPDGTGLARLSDWLVMPAAAVAVTLITDGQRRGLLRVAAVLVLISSVAALLQHRGWWPSPEAFRHLSWTRIPFSRAYEPVLGQPDRFYGVGLAMHRLKFANAAGIVAVALFAVALLRTGWQRWVCVAIVGLTGVSMFVAAQARAASAALFAALVVMAILARLRWTQIAGLISLVIVAVALAIAVSPGVRARTMNLFQRDDDHDRRVLWSLGVRAVESSPFTGVGLGRYRTKNFAPPGTSVVILDHPGKTHNQFLSFAAEIGIPGAFLFAWLLVWIFVKCRGDAGLFGRGAVVFFALLCMTHDPLFHETVSSAFVLAFGVGLGLLSLSPALPRKGQGVTLVRVPDSPDQ